MHAVEPLHTLLVELEGLGDPEGIGTVDSRRHHTAGGLAILPVKKESFECRQVHKAPNCKSRLINSAPSITDHGPARLIVEGNDAAGLEGMLEALQANQDVS